MLATCAAACAPSATTAPITSPGSPASFAPLPAAALAASAGGAVRTSFTNLAFDPYSNPMEAAASGRPGVTQLTISAAPAAPGRRSVLQSPGFSPVKVAALPTLIQFSLPLPLNLNGSSGLKAVCSFWDASAAAYSTAGCVGLPNPSPPGLPLAFRPPVPYYSSEDSRVAEGSGPAAGPALRPGFAFSDPSDTQLQSAWFVNESFVNGTLFWTANCIVRLLDCSDPAQVNVSIFPDPQRPISIPAVGCGGVVANRSLRIYTNDPWIRPPQPCPLWDAAAQAALLGAPPCVWNASAAAFQGPGCDATCYWNATAQSFGGGGCVAAPVTACGCRHLTAFATSSAPTISVCSASSMLSISPADILTKLRMFLILIAGLFGGMHLGAAAAYLVDLRDYRRSLSSLLAPESDPKYCGFAAVGPEQAWSWLLEQSGTSSSKDVYAVQGTLVQAAAVIGLPAARLRMAIPEEARTTRSRFISSISGPPLRAAPFCVPSPQPVRPSCALPSSLGASRGNLGGSSRHRGAACDERDVAGAQA